MFNNFSILSELIVENRTLAERFLENLSSVYRYVIQNLKRDTVPAADAATVPSPVWLPVISSYCCPRLLMND